MGVYMKVTEEMELESTAYHEAGHAVASYAMRTGPLGVSIVPNDEELGRCRFSSQSWLRTVEDGIPNTRTRLRVEGVIIVDLAGGQAEMLFYKAAKAMGRVPDDFDSAGKVNPTAESDLRTAFRKISFLAKDLLEEEAYLGFLAERARVILEYEYWPAVEAVAEELLQTRALGKRKVRAIISAAMLNPDRQAFYEKYGYEPVSMEGQY
jgi:ATP-dependent Zn protease